MITITFILTSVALLFFVALRSISVLAKEKKEKLFRQLSKEGAANGLTFCSQEMLSDKLIGIDGIQRKILILEKNKKSYNTSVISLEEVHDCRLVSNETDINAAHFKTFSEQLRNVVLELRFEFNNSQKTTSINFTKGLISSKRGSC